MQDFLLRFSDSEVMLTELGRLGMVDDSGLVVSATHQFAANNIGEIPGHDGWHVNIRVLDPNLDLTSLEPFRVFPVQPYCVWA